MPAIAFTFGGRGATEFGEMTGNHVGQQLCIILDGTMIQQANIQERIDGRGRITGSFSEDEVNDIVTLLRAGSLPASWQTSLCRCWEMLKGPGPKPRFAGWPFTIP